MNNFQNDSAMIPIKKIKMENHYQYYNNFFIILNILLYASIITLIIFHDVFFYNFNIKYFYNAINMSVNAFGIFFIYRLVANVRYLLSNFKNKK